MAKDVEKDEDFKAVTHALTVAIYFLVLARRRNPSEEDDDEETSDSRKMDKKTFVEMRQTGLVCLGLPSTERRHRDDVDQWIALIMEQGWVNGNEWFENVPQAGEIAGDEAYLSGEDEDGDNDGKGRYKDGMGSLMSKDDSRGGLLPGLGTMMQDRVDWLSEDRREDYVDWKADIMGRIERMARVGA